MSKLIDSFLDDAIQHEKVQSLFQRLLTKLLDMLTPLLIGIAIVWGVTLLASVATLYFVVHKGGGLGV